MYRIIILNNVEIVELILSNINQSKGNKHQKFVGNWQQKSNTTSDYARVFLAYKYIFNFYWYV